MKVVGTILGVILGVILGTLLVLVALVATTALVAACALPSAAILWVAWMYSGEPLTGLQVGFIEAWAGVVFLASLRSILVYGVVSKELAARAANRVAKK